MLETDVSVRPQRRGPPDGPGGTSFATLLMQDDGERAEALDALLAELPGSDIRVTRLTDATLASILAHATGPKGDTLHDGGARLVVRALAERQSEESRVLLLMERAETLRAETLRSLQRMALHFAQEGQPTLQVLFVGHPSFRTLLDDPTLASLRTALGLNKKQPARVTAGPPLVPAVPPRNVPRWRGIVPLSLLGTFAFAATAAAYLTFVSWQTPSHPRVIAPEPTSATPPVVGSPGAQPADPPPPPPTSLPLPSLRQPSTLVPRRTALPALANHEPTAAPMAGLTMIERPIDPAPAAPTAVGPRVVVHVAGEADPRLDQVLAALAQRPGRVDVRHVSETPNRPGIRYYYAEDEAAARQIAAALATPRLTWAVRSFTSFRPLPSPGTIEVWLPGHR